MQCGQCYYLVPSRKTFRYLVNVLCAVHFADAGLCLVFATPKEMQDHNAHDYLGGFNAEQETLYNKSGKLNNFLSEWDSKDVDTIPKSMDDLWSPLIRPGTKFRP